jgi:hypothetical protein
MTTTSDKARVLLDGDELSFLIGMCRSAIDECDEQLEEPIMHDANGEERAWLERRRRTAHDVEHKLERAGRRL